MKNGSYFPNNDMLIRTLSKPSNHTQSRLDTAPPEVIKNIILEALNVVSNDYSLHSAGGNGDFFQEMFPDSEMVGKLR